MPTETDYAADLGHAWYSIKYEAQHARIETTGERAVSDAEIALIEPGIRLLELSAAYREAHAAHAAALTAALQGQCRPLVSAAAWGRLEDERRAAESVMEAAKSALLSAALDIT